VSSYTLRVLAQLLKQKYTDFHLDCLKFKFILWLWIGYFGKTNNRDGHKELMGTVEKDE
jgi:hypothetical protein